MNGIVTTRLDCGLTLIVEPIVNVASAAISWLLPIGAATDPPDGDGHAALLGEMIFRGAGGLSSREHSDALDRLGIERSSQVLTHHLRLGATLLGSRLDEALPLLVAMVREPALNADHLDAVRSLALQALDGLDDEPQHLVMLRVRAHHLPPPFNRHGYGERAVLQRATIDELRSAWRARCLPGGSILAVAGAVDPPRIASRLNQLLRGWTGQAAEPRPAAPARGGYSHLDHPTAQVHIGAAWTAPREADPHSMLERLAIGVLSGGTSARLFTEVRQKRSLCYSVGASYNAGRDYGVVSLYAGTTPERARQTLDVCLEEIERLRLGATADEFRRAVVGLKSHLVMQGESTAARAAALGYDFHRIGRARSLAEVAALVDAVTFDALTAYLASRRIGDITVASIGPAPIASTPPAPAPGRPTAAPPMVPTPSPSPSPSTPTVQPAQN
jgi:predicted Zn-dependent peptidase